MAKVKVEATYKDKKYTLTKSILNDPNGCVCDDCIAAHDEKLCKKLGKHCKGENYYFVESNI